MNPLKRLSKAFFLIAALTLMLGGCGAAPSPTSVPAATTAPVVQPANTTAAVVQPVNTAAPVAAATPTAAAAKPKGTLTVALSTDIAAIELPQAPERQAANAASTMYDGLLYPTADGKLEPALAESWDVAADGTTYTFKLRKDVTFHNGEPFTADAVVFSWTTYSKPDVRYASTWTIADTMTKVDDYTVKATTKSPNALLLRYASGWAMIPPKYYASVGPQAFAQKPVGTGPFVFKEWIKGDHLTVTANPNYWRKGYPKVDQVVFKFMPEPATRVQAIKAGEIDIASRLTSSNVKELGSAAGITVVHYPVDRVYYVAFNNVTSGKGQPTEKKEVRLALNYAVNRPGIIKAIFDGYGQLASGFVGTSDLGFDKSDPYPYDPAQAKTLLGLAGYPNGFAMDMSCPSNGYPGINDVCQAVASDFGKVGVKVNLNLMEANAFWALEEKKQLPPLYIDSWSVTLGEAYPRLSGALAKDETYAAWYDAGLAKMITDLVATIDISKRAALYGTIQKQMRDDPPFVYLYYPEAFEAVRSRVSGYQPRAAEDYFLWDVSVSN